MVLSWGRIHRFEHTLCQLAPGGEAAQAAGFLKASETPLIAHGLGRSYGDVGLNEGGGLILTSRLNHFFSADWGTGVIRAAAGLSSEELLRVCVPRGWFLPVSPGTKFVTLGGAVANDVHGKNHHRAGSFGAHVRRIGLLRSDRGLITCSRDENADLFALTIGGLGLTGLILWVEIQLSPIRSAYLDVENLACRSLEDFFRLSAESDAWPYTVMWVDCFAKGRSLGRGIFTRGRPRRDLDMTVHGQKTVSWPVIAPGFLLNRMSISAFNALYRRRPAARYCGSQHYDPFFYPLDGIRGWNRMYGPRGFYQHQSLIPYAEAEAGIAELLRRIAKGGQGSFLAVLKVHGEEPSPGVMSFCRPGKGVSLALDFANRGKSTRRLLSDLDLIVRRRGGRLYPAKDAHMAADFFQESYPDWRRLEEARDRALSSSFWRRVTQTSGAIVQT
jgi:L-gulonolactone oxidase